MRKVLIIEDRRENIVFIANNILKPLGYEVITAMDGPTGLSKAQEESPDLIISDLKLPGMGGLEVLEQLRQNGFNIPTIVMTFHGTEETAVKALRLGACDYLIKPFTLDEMQAALERAAKQIANSGHKAPDNSAEQARLAELAQEVKQLKITLSLRERQLGQAQQLLANRTKSLIPAEVSQAVSGTGSDNQSTQLRQELTQMRNALAVREQQLSQLQRQLANSVQKLDMAEAAQRAATWEEDNARLNQVLAESKQKLAEAEKRAGSLEDIIVAQRMQLGRYQEESKRMADQLRNLSEAVRLLSQDLGQQIDRLGVVSPRDKKK
ncbi:MAG: response regulator [Anaerolineae bacterium]